MNINIPGLAETLALTKNLPEQFDTLIGRMDTLIKRLDTLVGLVEETNDILREK